MLCHQADVAKALCCNLSKVITDAVYFVRHAASSVACFKGSGGSVVH